MKLLRSSFLLIISCCLLIACNVDYETMASQRLKYAQKNQGEIVIAAFQDSAGSPYIKGAMLAVEEINQQKGLLGRPLKLLVEQDSPDFVAVKPTIRRIVSNPKVSAVMGHRSAVVAMPASAIYEKAQILFFSPFVTEEELTSHGFGYTFRLLADDKQLVKQMCSLGKILGFKKIAVLYARADEHRKFALLFKETVRNDFNLVFDQAFFGEALDFRSILSDLKQYDADVIFLSGGAKTASRLTKQAREMGITIPVMGSRKLDSEIFKTSAGVAGNNTIVPTPYNVQAKNPINQLFVAHYRNKYNQLPDADAAQGYDSVMLFADKVETAQSTQPALLASIVRFSPSWTGISGMYRFNKEGNIQGKPYFFQVLDNENWQMLSAISPKEF
ncbi:MAG: ABC transporter substrate-binding protein [gamma proteobacterium symbiont of Taylorina sp.]|nr:ABC transporter substrate-binding protein [gamma proteobacterium symbiont of Taylorina sp.]